jgi:hypothetical protein
VRRHGGAASRLADLELDLGIAGYQTAAWEVFVESFAAVIQALHDGNTEFMVHFADAPRPCLMGSKRKYVGCRRYCGPCGSWTRASTTSTGR